MELKPRLSKSHQRLVTYLKLRGPQSIRVLAKKLEMTKMGIRQHLHVLRDQGITTETGPIEQKRGRPAFFWTLTEEGHSLFNDHHSTLLTELLEDIRNTTHGAASLDEALQARQQRIQHEYDENLSQVGNTLSEKIQAIASLRNSKGYVSEARLLPAGWLLIENHNPILSAEKYLQAFIDSDLLLLRFLLSGLATVSRTENLLNGQRRSAFRIMPV
ncbi:MAG: hypothetical protein CMD92_05795 [Gammaproteobacteria bacterium]|nr:hypothetical protein [Gammaproteobacteria bacterium]